MLWMSGSRWRLHEILAALPLYNITFFIFRGRLTFMFYRANNANFIRAGFSLKEFYW